MKKSGQARKFLKPGEAAERLACTPNTLATWSRKIPAVRAACVVLKSEHRRYDEARIDAYAASLGMER